MRIRKISLAALALAVAFAFSPLPELQAATLSPGSGPSVDSSLIKVAKKSAKKAKKAKKRSKGKSAKSKKSCGTFMYYNKKTRKCADARLKK
jgi:hypothetical protein